MVLGQEVSQSCSLALGMSIQMVNTDTPVLEQRLTFSHIAREDMGGAGFTCDLPGTPSPCRDQRPLSAFIYFAMSGAGSPREGMGEGEFWNIFLSPGGGKLFQNVWSAIW